MERVLDLTLKMADEGLSPEESAELEHLIESEPLARRRHLQVLEVEAALRTARHTRSSEALATAPSDSLMLERRVAAVLEQIRRPSLLSWRRGFRARTTGLVAGALAAAAAIMLVARPARHHAEGTPAAMAHMNARPPGRHDLTAGPRGSAAVLPLRAGRPAEWFSIELDEGASLEVRGRAVLGVDRAGDEGGHVNLADGTISYERSGAGQTSISTPQGEVLMHGGRAVVTVSPGGTHVSVLDGTATISPRDGHATSVAGRQGASVAGGRATVSALPSALFIGGDLGSGVPSQYIDQAMVRRLEDLGFAVEPVDERRLRPEQLQSRSLIVISPTVTSRMHDRAQELSLADSNVPIFCSRPTLFEDLGMTAPGKAAAQFTNQKKMISIIDAEHPLAAGLHGEVDVLDANMNVGWGVPGPAAARIAVIRNRPDHSTIFAYDRDAPLLPPAGRAPARRVGFFLHPTAARFMNDQAWQLFDAAIKWAAEDAP